jgi:phosphoribulokinase
MDSRHLIDSLSFPAFQRLMQADSSLPVCDEGLLELVVSFLVVRSRKIASISFELRLYPDWPSTQVE